MSPASNAFNNHLQINDRASSEIDGAIMIGRRHVLFQKIIIIALISIFYIFSMSYGYRIFESTIAVHFVFILAIYFSYKSSKPGDDKSVLYIFAERTNHVSGLRRFFGLLVVVYVFCIFTIWKQIETAYLPYLLYMVFVYLSSPYIFVFFKEASETKRSRASSSR